MLSECPCDIRFIIVYLLRAAKSSPLYARQKD